MCSKTNPQCRQETKRQSVRGLKKIVRTAVSVLILYLTALPTPAPATDYSTKFPNAEALISEGGHWITAGTPGVNWYETLCGDHGDLHVSRVSTTPGYAFGPTGPERFGDSLALLTGNWKPDQMAEATVRQVDPVGYPEVEIRLRTSPKDATGYEIMWSALGKKKTAYLSIATWNGPGSKPPHYTILKSLKGPEYGVVTGDVIKGMIVGHTITAYTNGRLQFQITDSTFATGNPGFGLNEGPNGTYGISSFTASDRVSGTRDATSSLSGTGAVDIATSYHADPSGIPNTQCVTEMQSLGSFGTPGTTGTPTAGRRSPSSARSEGMGRANLMLLADPTATNLPALTISMHALSEKSGFWYHFRDSRLTLTDNTAKRRRAMVRSGTLMGTLPTFRYVATRSRSVLPVRVVMRPVYAKGSSSFVTSTAASVATGRSEPVPGRYFPRC